MSPGRFFGHVHQTMSSRSPSATPISRKMTHIVCPAAKLTGAILLGATLAACSPLPARNESSALPVLGQQSCPAATPCPACPACAPPKPAPTEARYRETAWPEVPAWSQTPLLLSLKAFIAGCARAQSRRPFQLACATARKAGVQTETEARAFFETNFVAYRVTSPDGHDEGLVTGYYEPVLKGSRKEDADFRHPVYAAPDDLIVVDFGEMHPELHNLRLRGRLQGRRLVPYFSRSEIDAPASGISARPLAWVADAVELFFLQVQGSGLIEFPDGYRMRAGFADQNGHPYRSLGRYLIDRGELKQDQASMQSIKAWAAANPAKLQAALNSNPSYVFFRELPPPSGPLDGPPGAMGVQLMPGYSAAVDPRFIPLGSPLFLATTFPLSDQPLDRLVMAQDTGGAIRGAVRVDFFWGTGEEAGMQAGRMRQQGKVWLLWPRGEPLPKQQ